MVAPFMEQRQGHNGLGNPNQGLAGNQQKKPTFGAQKKAAGCRSPPLRPCWLVEMNGVKWGSLGSRLDMVLREHRQGGMGIADLARDTPFSGLGSPRIFFCATTKMFGVFFWDGKRRNYFRQKKIGGNAIVSRKMVFVATGTILVCCLPK